MRPRSPYARGHVRSQSHSAATPGAPGLARAKSMPGAINFTFGRGGAVRTGSPAGSGSPSRQRALRKPVDEPMPGSSKLVIRGPKLGLDTHNLGGGAAGGGTGSLGGTGQRMGMGEVGSSIPEEDEETPRGASLELPRSSSPNLYPGLYSPNSQHWPRRPSSPLRNYSLNPYAGSGSGSGGTSPTSPLTGASPLYPTRYDLGGGGAYHFPPAASSVSSTPNSLRSRSPSISSLETIPDIPDREAEEEKEMLGRLRREAERGEEDGSGSGSDSDGRQGGGEGGTGGVRGRRVMVGGRDKSKRWSVCGAERRQDLDLETIWED